MKNTEMEAIAIKTQLTLDENLKLLAEAESLLEAMDSRIFKTQKTIQETKFCINNTQELLNSYPFLALSQRSNIFNQTTQTESTEQILQQLVLELRYFSHFVNQLAHLDPYYSQLHHHYEKLVQNLTCAS
jgi:hypothetical protein